MNMQLVRYYFIELFSKFKYIFIAVLLISAVIIALQYAPTREFGVAYKQLSEQFSGPFSKDKDLKMADLVDKHTQMVATAYGDLQSTWLENFYNFDKNDSDPFDASELWEESQKFVNKKGEYGKTLYDDMLILSRLIHAYQDLKQIEDQCHQRKTP